MELEALTLKVAHYLVPNVNLAIAFHQLQHHHERYRPPAVIAEKMAFHQELHISKHVRYQAATKTSAVDLLCLLVGVFRNNLFDEKNLVYVYPIEDLVCRFYMNPIVVPMFSE